MRRHSSAAPRYPDAYEERDDADNKRDQDEPEKRVAVAGPDEGRQNGREQQQDEARAGQHAPTADLSPAGTRLGRLLVWSLVQDDGISVIAQRGM